MYYRSKFCRRTCNNSHTRTHTHIYTCIYTHTHMYIYSHTHTHIHIHTRVHVHMYNDYLALPKLANINYIYFIKNIALIIMVMKKKNKDMYPVLWCSCQKLASCHKNNIHVLVYMYVFSYFLQYSFINYHFILSLD